MTACSSVCDSGFVLVGVSSAAAARAACRRVLVPDMMMASKVGWLRRIEGPSGVANTDGGKHRRGPLLAVVFGLSDVYWYWNRSCLLFRATRSGMGVGSVTSMEVRVSSLIIRGVKAGVGRVAPATWDNLLRFFSNLDSGLQRGPKKVQCRCGSREVATDSGMGCRGGSW